MTQGPQQPTHEQIADVDPSTVQMSLPQMLHITRRQRNSAQDQHAFWEAAYVKLLMVTEHEVQELTRRVAELELENDELRQQIAQTGEQSAGDDPAAEQQGPTIDHDSGGADDVDPGARATELRPHDPEAESP